MHRLGSAATGAESGPHRQNLLQSMGASKGHPDPQLQDEKDDMLDLVNKVQMFRIATKKINHNLEVKGKTPVFKLAAADP